MTLADIDAAYLRAIQVRPQRIDPLHVPPKVAERLLAQSHVSARNGMLVFAR